VYVRKPSWPVVTDLRNRLACSDAFADTDLNALDVRVEHADAVGAVENDHTRALAATLPRLVGKRVDVDGVHNSVKRRQHRDAPTVPILVLLTIPPVETGPFMRRTCCEVGHEAVGSERIAEGWQLPCRMLEADEVGADDRMDHNVIDFV